MRLAFACLFSALISISAILFLYLLNQSFFFHDDMQHQYMPVFHDIARILKSGHFPFVSANTWYQGNYAGEYQFGIYNPISLISYLFISNIDDFNASALLLVLFYTIIASISAVYLGRVIGLSYIFSIIYLFYIMIIF